MHCSVVLRNPWGDSEWTGRWGDGSKEWTEEWLPALKVLQHSFGDDGEFVLECKSLLSFPQFDFGYIQLIPVFFLDSDFLENFDTVERTLL